MNVIEKVINEEYPPLFAWECDFATPDWLWESAEGGKVKCGICRHSCVIPKGGTGFCMARENRDGVMYTRGFGSLGNLYIDRFLFNVPSLVVGGHYCNYRCRFCFAHTWINHKKELPKGVGFTFPFKGLQMIDGELKASSIKATPEMIVSLCLEQNIKHIQMACNEPTVNIEYTMLLAELALRHGIATTLWTNGYSNERVTRYYAKTMSRIEVGVKTLDQDAFDRTVSPGKKVDVNGILENLIILHDNKADFCIHLLADGEHADPKETVKMMGKFKDAIGPAAAAKIPITVLAVERYANNRIVFDVERRGAVPDHLNVRPGDIIGALELEMSLKRMGFKNTTTHYSSDYKTIHGNYPAFFPEEAKCGRLAEIEKKPVDNSLRSYVYLGQSFDEAPKVRNLGE